MAILDSLQAGGNPMMPSGMLRAVTPNDGADLPDGPCRGLIAEVAGIAVVDDLTGVAGGTAVSVFLVQGPNPYAVKRVRSTGTTATGIVAAY